jgi:hypothetical protein
MKNLIMILVFLIMNTSCKKVLEDKVYDKLVPDNFFQTDAEAIAASNAVYGALNGTGWDYYGPGNGLFPIMQDATTDIFAPTGPSGFFDLSTFSWKTDMYDLMANWQDMYKGISYSNYVLQYLPPAEKVSADLKKRIIAEAKTGLGMFYKDLTEMWGDVPLVLSFEQGLKEYPAKSPITEVLSYAKKNLFEAIPDLPVSYGQGDYGRFTRGGAYALLSKIYLQEKKWDSVIYACDQVIGTGEYVLEPVYANLFIPQNHGNKEFIIVRPSLPDFNVGNDYPTYSIPQDFKLPAGVSIQAWNGYRVRRSFYETFDPADMRAKHILTKYENTSGDTTYLNSPLDLIFMKYAIDPAAFIVFGSNDIPIIRLADILLEKAEALNQLNGPSPEAIDLINQVRDRAFGNDPSKRKNAADFASKQELDDWILQERAWELYFEGQRRMDLLRHDKFLAKAGERNVIDPTEKRKLFPIPQSEIDANPNLAQNNGY